jgi:hypothetical protein
LTRKAIEAIRARKRKRENITEIPIISDFGNVDQSYIYPSISSGFNVKLELKKSTAARID